MQDFRVADLVFSYNNHELISLLKDRGAAIIKHDWKEVENVHSKITAKLKEKDTLYEWTRPTTAFITFEEEEGKIFAKETLKDTKHPFLNHSLKDACEPTDIIWENRHYTKTDITKREIIYYGGIILVLVLSFYLIYFLSVKSIQQT